MGLTHLPESLTQPEDKIDTDWEEQESDSLHLFLEFLDSETTNDPSKLVSPQDLGFDADEELVAGVF